MSKSKRVKALAQSTFLPLFFLGQAVFAAGPVTIDDNWVAKYGSTVSGSYTGTSAKPAISVTTQKPITIYNAFVTGPNDLIYLSTGTNASIIQTTGVATNPNIYGAHKGTFVKANRPASLLVRNCTDTGSYFGVYVVGYASGSTTGRTIQILKNIFNNIDGRASNGSGGYLSTSSTANSHAHAIQLNQVQGISGIEIAWNQSIVTPLQGLVSDVINIYSSSGKTTSPIRVHDNYVQGAMGANPADGARYSGGGIITDGRADDSLATATAYVQIYNNQVVMTGNYGVAIAAGHDNQIYNNRVVSSGKLANGTLYAMMYANGANNANLQKQPTTVFKNNHVHDNVLGLLRPNKANQLTRSDWYLPGQNNQVENNQHLAPYNNSNPTLQAEKNEWTSWQKKLTDNNIKIGA